MMSLKKWLRIGSVMFGLGKMVGSKQGLLRRQHVDNRATFLGGLGLGSLAMYLFDPDRGKKRLSTIRDTAVKAANRSGKVVSVASKDLRNRASGVVAETRSLVAKKTSSRPEREHEVGGE
jgi:hypothetical protein